MWRASMSLWKNSLIIINPPFLGSLKQHVLLAMLADPYGSDCGHSALFFPLGFLFGYLSEVTSMEQLSLALIADPFPIAQLRCNIHGIDGVEELTEPSSLGFRKEQDEFRHLKVAELAHDGSCYLIELLGRDDLIRMIKLHEIQKERGEHLMD